MANNDRTNTTDERATAAEQSSTSTRLSQAEQNALQFAQNETAAEPTPVDPATGQPVAEPTSQAAVPDVPETITPDADNVVRLPQGVSIDEIRLDGNNLVLVQPDGSTVTILNAALKVPTFLIGDVEIPELALAAALQANGIDVAAGPDGALTVVSAASQSGGGGFNTPNGDIGDAGPVIDLLPPTALQFGTLERRELFPSIRENDFPELSIVSLGTPPGQVNESALASGSGGGTTSTLGNILVDPGDDGLGSLVVTNASGVSVDVTNGGSIQGVYGELIVTPNGDGTYSFEYVLTTNTIDHDNAGQTGADDVVTDTFDFVVTDGNGDTASDELTVTITDDGPAIDLAPAEESEIVLDETDNDADDGDVGGLLADLTVPGSALFTETATPGADGEQSKVYSLVLNAGATGLTDTLSGEPVVLSEEGGAIVGRTETGGDEVFRISVDANTGDITVSQSRALFHDQNPGSDAEAHDESLTPEVMNSGLVSLNVVLTDGDGDTASDTAELGALIKFQDDGPAAEAVADATATVLLDESDGTGSGADGINPGTITGATIEGLFAAPAFGADGAGSVAYTLSATNGAQTGLWLTGESAPGDEIILVKVSDTEYQGVAGGAGGTPAFTISIDGATGAVTVTQHETLEHTVDGADHDDALALSGAAAISVVQTVTDGDGDTASATSANALGITFEDDGPKAEAVAGVAASVLLDESDGTGSGADGINPGTISGAVISGLFAAPAYGADGAGSVAYTLSATNGAQTGLWLTGESLPGDEIILVKVSDTEYQGVAGGAGGTPAFTISIDGATGAVMVTQHETLEHTTDGGSGAAHDDALALSGAAAISVVQTVTDGDGDTASATSANALGITFEDDGPKAEAVAGATASVLLDESDGTGSGADGVNPGTISGAVISALFAAPAYGADGAGSVAYTLSATDGAQTGLWLTGESLPGDEIILVKVSDTEYQGVAGGAGGTPAFTISIDGATGAVTVTQHETLEHTVDGADHDDALALSGNAAISVVQTVTDGDGDTASATSANALGITFEDDGPKAEAVAGVAASVLVDESDGTGSGADGINPGTISGAVISALFAAPAYGADGAGSVAYTLSATDGAQTGLWLTGESAPGDEIILVKVSDTEYQGVAGGAGGTPAFTISIDGATGAVTVTQHETLEHTVDGADHDDALALSGNAAISVVQTVTDGDGDTASATSANALGITFEDDGPKADAVAGATASVLLDESDGTGSGADGINPGTISGAVISALFAAPAYGADGSGSVAYTLSATDGAQTGLWLTGESAPGDEIILVKVSDTEYQGVAGGAGGTLAFTISIDGGTGAVTVTQHETLEHTVDGADHDDALALSGTAAISVVQTVTDGDGDTASATSANALGITFEDDGPAAEAVAGVAAFVLLDESDGTGSGADGINPGTIPGADIQSLFAAPAYGADGMGSVAYTLSATNGAQTGLWLTGTSGAGNEIILVKVSDTEYQGVAGGAGGTPAFTISIDGATGAVTVTQHETLEHTVDGADHDDALALSGNAAVSVVQTVTDGDGDTASATSANALGITFEDDGPKAEAVAGATASVLLDESDGTGSGADGINPGTISGAVISGLFAAPAYGADGAGSVAYTLSATDGAQTGLWLTGESAPGDEIILVKVSDTEYQGVAGGAGGTPAFTISIDGATGAVTVTQHETLEHTVDGADHDDALALSGNAAVSVVQTVTDGDGDTASATSANALGITFEDDGPKAEAVAGATATVLLDESDGTGSGADGVNPGTISGAVISGLFAAPAYGADGAGSVAYTLSATNGAQTGLWLTGESAPGDEIILVKVSDTEYQGVAGGAGGTPAFTISIDGATGAVTVTQHETLEHTTDGGSGADHDDALALSGNAAVSVVQTVTDGDGDTASATSANALGITFEDDGPAAEAVAGVAAFVNLDESDGTGSGADGINPGTIPGADIQSLFAAPAYGADGAGSVAYTLSATNGAQTGLWLTGASGVGNEIILVKVSDTEYQGVAGGAGGTPAFTISIDGGTGAVTVTQHQTLEHTADGGPGLAHDDVLTLSGAAAISVVQTVTDGDGDTASATSANALRIGFQDDGPKAEAVAGATATVLLDESDGTGSGADGVNPGTIPGAVISGLFAAPAYGADGAGSVAYTLSATNGAQTGLWLTGESAPGDEIILVKVSDTEYQGVAGGAGGTPAFTISIDGATGAVTVTQHETLEHTTDGGSGADHDDALALSGNAAVSVVQTVTDGDGDTASATSANALGITFEDDGPAAEAVAGATASVLLDESDGTGSGADGINPGTISGAVISALFAAPAYGADGAGSVAYTLSATNGAQTGLWLTGESGAGNEIILVKVSDTEYQGVAGGAGGTLAFTISIDGATGAVTVTQQETLEHTTDGADHDDALALSGAAAISVVQTVTDGDGDTASATSANALGITFEDDGPKAEAVAGATASVLLDESDGTGSGADGINPGTISGAVISGLFAAPAYGADGAGSVAYTLSATNGAQTGLWLTGESLPGDEIILVKVSDTEYQGVAGGAGGTPAFTISIDGATGAVTVTQHETLEHTVDGADHDDALALSGNAAISVVQTVTDGDGDTASATSANALGITFEDDGPKADAVAGATASVLLDESDGTGSGADGINPGTISGAVISGLFAAPAYGADGSGSVAYTLSATNGAQTGLWLTGESAPGDEIILVKVSDTEYQGVAGGAGGTPAFTISIDGATGAVTVTQHETLEHTVDGADHDDALALSGTAAVSVVQTVTDGDGDTASATSANALGIAFEDDGPKAEAVAGATATVLLDESDGTGSGADGINPGTISGAVISGLFAAPAYGADGAGSVAYTLSATNGAQTGLWLTGESAPGDEIILVKVSDTEYQGVAGGAGGTPAFTISIDGATGAVTVTQHETLEHTVDGGPGADHDDALALSGAASISVVQTVTDGDGDTASATSANALGITFEDDGPTVIVPEDAVLSNSAGAPQEFDLDVDGMVTDNYGADGAGTVRFTVTDGQDSGLTSGGQPVTYHLSAGGTVLTAKVGGAGGTTVFTVTLDPADGTYTVDMDRPVDAFTQVDFDPGIYDFVGGNDPWAGFVPNGQDGNSPGGSPVDDNSRDLLLTPIGASGSSINGNAASAGVGGGSGGQNIGAGEGIRLDFVQDLTGDPAGSPADYQGNPAQQDHLFDGHYTVNGAAVTFGDGSTDTTIQLSAFDDPDGNTTVGDGTGDDITSIVIAYDGENQVITYDPLDTYPTTVTVGSPGGLADRSYTVDFVTVGGARVAQVTGVLDTQVTITSFTADGYNSLEVLYISGDDFAMTGFGTSVVSTDPVDFTLPIEIVDGDGDTAPAEIDLTLQPDAAPTISAFTAEVNEAGLAGGSEEGTASTVDTGTISIALASGDTLDTFEVSDANGNWVDVTGGGTVQGKFGLLTVTANGSGGYSTSYQLNQNSLDHNVRPSKGTPEGVAERFNVRAKDNDGDYSAVDTLKVNVLDDAPEAVADNASLTLGTENFNIAFVLDFSGSVSNSELDAMLDAVKAAGQAFFDGTSGNVQIELVAFSSSASAAGPFTDYASFAAQIDGWNPAEGGSRPYNGGTDFTAAIEETMDAYTPLSDHNNQVFFLSDGNPNEQIGAGGHSLYGSTQTAWNNFVQNNDVTVQTVGIGNNIDVEQLQDVDEADGSDVVVSVSNFDGLVTALLDLTNQVDVSGNVLLGNDNAVGGGDDDILGADDGRILSITVDGVTYTYQEGPDKIFNDGSQPAISGSSLVVDGSLGGELSFNFETGAWSYQADGDTTPGTESFDYVLVDNDGDTSGASLTIDILPPPGATDDVVLTNITDYSAIDIPTAALLHNDPAPAPTSPLSVDGASNPQNGGVSLAGDVTFTPSSTPVEFVDEDFSSGEGSFVYRDAYYPGTGSEAHGFQTSSGPASGGALKIELGDGGWSDRYNANGAFTRAFNLASAATVTITFDYYAMLTAETDVGEDVRVLAGVDGEAFGSGGVVDELLGASGSGGGDAVTGWKTFTTTIDLSAGDHTLALGGLLTQKTASGEFADVYFDNVSVEYTPTPSFTSGGFDYSVSDGSGFTDDAHVSVTGVSGSTITGTDADEVLVGNDSGSTLLGMGGDDSLVGGDAADLLDGGEGDDLLIGGDGADVLIGGEGQNTYDLTDTDNAVDTVVLDPSALTGMNPDEIIGFSSEDVVDLTELVSLSTTSGENVGDFVRLNPGDGKELQVDADGTAGGDDWVTVATFDVPQTPASIKILYDDDGSDTSGTV